MPTYDNLAVAHDLLAAIEAGDGGKLLTLYADDAIQIEYPNRLKAKGDRRSVATLAADFERGKTILQSQRYEIVNAVASGGHVMLEVRWTGTLAMAIGALQAGDDMVSHSAISFQFQNGKIIAQRNYDCFNAF